MFTWSSSEVVKEGSLVNMTVVLENKVFLMGHDVPPN